MSSRWREFTLLPGFSSSPVMMFHLFWSETWQVTV
jgi:hypothetical protein